MLGRGPVTKTIGELEVVSQPLPFPRAEELLPDVAEILALAANDLGAALADVDLTKGIAGVGISKFAPAVISAARSLGAGRLQKLAPKITATTVVVMQDIAGEKRRYELGKTEDRNAVFDAHPDAYFPILIFAGSVTFKRFFPASALRGAAIPTASG